MSSYDLFVALGNVDFTLNDNNRYQDIDSKFIIKQQFSNARMIKNNTVDIPLSFDIVNKYNYGYYHTTTDSKKYYFFTISCDYINDATTRITFKVDWFSTDFKNITFTTSFVQRMHPTLDTLANYPRTLENVGNQYPLVTNYIDVFNLDYTNAIYIVATTHAIPTKKLFIEADETAFNTPIYQKIYGFFTAIDQTLHSGELDFCYFVCATLNEVNIYVKNALANGYDGAIGGIWRVPSFFGKSDYTKDFTINVKYGDINYSENIKILTNSERILQLSANGFIFAYPSSVDNYTPVYKKCLDAQYINPCILANDIQIVYNYNYFKTQENQNNVINLFFDCKGDSNIYIVPYQYNGSNEHDFTNCTTVKISVPVQISCNNSVYIKDLNFQNTTKVQQTLANSSIDLVTATFKSFFSAKTEDNKIPVVNAFTTELEKIGEIGVNVTKQSIDNLLNMYNSCRGVTIVGGTGNTTISKLSEYGQNIHFGFVSYNTADIQKVDKYFSMFGYNYSQLMVPTLRDTYTFLQGDINFIGDINNESFTEIKNMFMGGVTIWNETELYNYDV